MRLIKSIKKKLKRNLIQKNNPIINKRFGLDGTTLKSNGTDGFIDCTFECGGGVTTLSS